MLDLPYISPISPLYLPCISPISPLYLACSSCSLGANRIVSSNTSLRALDLSCNSLSEEVAEI